MALEITLGKRAAAGLASAVFDIRVRKRLSSGERSFELDVSFSIQPGITILFGASGAGKSTLLECIAGLIAPDEGRITFADRAIFDSEEKISLPSQKRRIGYVFQDLALFPHLNVLENIQYGIRNMRGKERERSGQAIAESFRITKLLRHKPSQISGGERQRVALARALAVDPCVLLLDEPLTALDVPTKSAIMDDLRAWNAARKIPVLYVTHNRDEVFALGEQVVVLDEGRKIAQGTPHAVMTVPRREKIAQLAGFENIFDATVIAVNEARGTMTCRIGETNVNHASVDIETPLIHAEPGAKLRVGISAGDILLATARPSGISAQNILPGKLIAMTQQDVILTATVDIGIRLAVHLTLAARDSLRLRLGADVWLIVKTHSCHLMAE
ncbi:MAG TPA: molybdenum ABC transporter ATP-binding protein [Terriglobales bacterium]|jgi:molybdate transport system ATP-binding protein